MADTRASILLAGFFLSLLFLSEDVYICMHLHGFFSEHYALAHLQISACVCGVSQGHQNQVGPTQAIWQLLH
jgi:hypothetical protein